MKRIITFASAMLLVGVAAFAATEDASWGTIKGQVKGDLQPAAKKPASGQPLATTYECAQPATATGVPTWWLPSAAAANAIDCDEATGWNSGWWGASSYTVTFDSPRVFSGLHITSVALPTDTQIYTITATRTDNTTDVISEPFTIITGPPVSKDFDLGGGFVEYKSVRIDINAGPVFASSWRAINEVQLIVPLNPEAKGDCKNGGWAQYGFRNQGQCVRFIETGKDSR